VLASALWKTALITLAFGKNPSHGITQNSSGVPNSASSTFVAFVDVNGTPDIPVEGGNALRTSIVNDKGVGMIESACGASLQFESPQTICIVCDVAGKHLPRLHRGQVACAALDRLHPTTVRLEVE